MFKASEHSPVIATAIAQFPFFAIQAMLCLDKNLRLDWDPKGLISFNSNLYNTCFYHLAQVNEVADAEAKALKGYAEVIRAAGAFPRALVPSLQTWLKSKK